MKLSITFDSEFGFHELYVNSGIKRESGEKPELYPQLYAFMRFLKYPATVSIYRDGKASESKASQKTYRFVVFSIIAFGIKSDVTDWEITTSIVQLQPRSNLVFAESLWLI